jgi:hypothetical protein
VTRSLLAVALALAAMTVGLCAAVVVAHNHARADRLAQLQRRLEMQRAANDQSEARAAAHVWGRADARAQAPEEPRAEGWQP